MRHAARVLLIGAVVLGLPARAHATPITLIAGSATVNVGDTFDIPISVGDTASLTSFQFDIGFNPSIVEFLSVGDTSTDFAAAAISSTGLTVFPQGSPVNFLSGVADSMFTVGTGLKPSGTIADIQFKALAAGTSPISFACPLCQDAFLTDNLFPLSSGVGGMGGGLSRHKSPSSSWLYHWRVMRGASLDSSAKPKFSPLNHPNIALSTDLRRRPD